MEENEYYLDLVYKNKKVRFKVTNPELSLAKLMQNVKHAIGKDGKLIFDFPSIDETGAPMDYFFGKEDAEVKELRVLRPRIGKRDQILADYGVQSGDTLFLIPDPFPG